MLTQTIVCVIYLYIIVIQHVIRDVLKLSFMCVFVTNFTHVGKQKSADCISNLRYIYHIDDFYFINSMLRLTKLFNASPVSILFCKRVISIN